MKSKIVKEKKIKPKDKDLDYGKAPPKGEVMIENVMNRTPAKKNTIPKLKKKKK